MQFFRRGITAVQKADKYHIFLAVFLMLLLSLLAYRDLTDHEINQYAILALMAIPLVILPYRYLSIYVCTLIPLCMGVNGYIMCFAYVAVLLKSRMTSYLQIVPVLLLCILELVHFCVFPTDADIKDYLYYCSCVGLFFHYIFDNNITNEKYDFILCLRAYCIVCCFVMAIMVANSLFYDLSLEEMMMKRNAYRSEENFRFSANANGVGYMALIVLSCMLLGNKRLRIPLPLYAVMMLISIGSGILSVSRTWLFTTLLIVFIFFVFSAGKKQKITIILLAVVCLVILPFFVDISIIGDGFMNRIEDESMSTAGGRTEIFNEYNSFMLDNPQYWLFGIGVFEHRLVADMTMSMHNGFQQIYVCYGIVGLCTFLFSLLFFVRKNHTMKVSILYHLPFFAYLICIMAGQFLTPCTSMLPFILASFVCRIQNNNIYEY